MKLRNFASPLTIASFVVVTATGLLMFFGFHGGFVKPAHEIFSLVFILGCALHCVANWKPLTRHLKRPLGAVLTIVFLVVTLVAILVPNDHDPKGWHGRHGHSSADSVVDSEASALSSTPIKPSDDNSPIVSVATID